MTEFTSNASEEITSEEANSGPVDKKAKESLFKSIFGSSFSFEKSFIATDVVLMAGKSDSDQEAPIEFKQEEGRSPKAYTSATDVMEDSRNMYKGERAVLPMGYDALIGRFDLTIANQMAKADKCDFKLLPLFRNIFREMMSTGAVQEVVARVAQQLASGEWMWRNVAYAENVDVEISLSKSPDKNFKFKFSNVPSISSGGIPSTSHYEKLTALRYIIMECFTPGPDGRQMRRCLTLSVVARVNGASARAEVFPSQLMKPSDKSDDKGREFYKIALGGDAGFTVGIRSVKAMNRVRCIDDWSTRSRESGVVAPISPLGTLLQYATDLRPNSGRESFYSIIGQMASKIGLAGTGDLNEFSSDERHYVAAQLLFGGLFAEETAKNAATREEKEAQKAAKKEKAKKPKEGVVTQPAAAEVPALEGA